MWCSDFLCFWAFLKFQKTWGCTCNDDEDDWCWFTPVTIFNCYFKLSHRVLTCRSHKYLRIGGEIWKVSRNVRERKISIHIGIIDIIIILQQTLLLLCYVPGIADRQTDSQSFLFNFDVIVWYLFGIRNISRICNFDTGIPRHEHWTMNFVNVNVPYLNV